MMLLKKAMEYMVMIKFSKKYIVDIGGNNVFYFDSSKNTFVKEK